MKNIFKNIGTLIISIMIVIYFAWSNYYDLKKMFAGSTKDHYVFCTEFVSHNNNKLIPFINKINQLKKENIYKKGLKCDDIEIIDADLNEKKGTDAAVIWGLYEQFIKSGFRQYNLSDFLDEFYSDRIQAEDRMKIIEEIRGWIRDPQMTTDLKNFIKEKVN